MLINVISKLIYFLLTIFIDSMYSKEYFSEEIIIAKKTCNLKSFDLSNFFESLKKSYKENR